MMIGSYVCVSKGKLSLCMWLDDWVNVWVNVIADRFQKFSENCKPANLSKKKKKKRWKKELVREGEIGFPIILRTNLTL